MKDLYYRLMSEWYKFLFWLNTGQKVTVCEVRKVEDDNAKSSKG